MFDPLKIPDFCFCRLLLRWFQPIYIRIFNLNAVDLQNVPCKGPYLIVGNHSHKLDPFFIGALIRRPIFQMASNEYFRIPLMRRFMWAMGAFPIHKDNVRPRELRHAIEIVQLEYPLAIYPEGGRNWDGKTLPILESTAKMVKLLNRFRTVPVMAVVSSGNYLAWPRWANRRRKSPVTIHCAEPVTFNERTPVKEIIDWMQKAIDHNDNYTNVEKIKGKCPAEGLTRLLWRCPDCRTVEGLIERNGNELVCTQCCKEWEVNLLCQMREVGTEVWKPIKEYADLMVRGEEVVPIQPDTTTFIEENEQVYLQSGVITLYHEPRYPRLKKVDDGRLHLTDRGLVFVKKSNGESIKYPFKEIRGRSTEKNYIFQIGTKERQIARFEMPHESCLKWEIYYDLIKYKNAD